jgi:Zn-dependent peptidase ImmA (M78 family)
MHAGRPLLLETTATQYSLNERRTGGEVPSPYEESQANRFAAELLMPERLIASLFSEIADSARNEEALIRGMAGEFGVSRSAMLYRLVNLGLMVPDPQSAGPKAINKSARVPRSLKTAS